MDGRGRVAVLVAGVVGLAAAVVLLRNTQEVEPGDRNRPPPSIAVAPTTVAKFADQSVILPEPGQPPDAVGDVRGEPGDRTLRLRWGQALSGVAPRGATGFEVRWGRAGALDNVMLVAASELELRGLTNGERYEAVVRSVDAFGQRSAPTTGFGVPEAQQEDPGRAALTGLYDNFHGDDAPNPARWAVQRLGRNCVLAGPGSGVEDDRLVLDLRCGNTEAVLRARVPMRLDQGSALGRITVVTDGPVPGGELSITVVPGPVTTLGVTAGGILPPSEPGRAIEDAALPPGTIRSVITTSSAVIKAASGLPRSATTLPASELSPVFGAPGVTARWDLQLATDGVTLRRDDELVASGDVLPDWSEATVLIGFAAPPGDSARVHVDAIGFTGQPGKLPNVADITGVVAGDIAFAPEPLGPPRSTFSAAPSAQSARLHLVIGPTAHCGADAFYADFYQANVPLQPSVPHGVPPNGPYCPLAAELTPELLDRLRSGSLSSPIVRSATSAGVALSGGVIEIRFPPGVAVNRKPATEPPGKAPDGEQHRLAHLSAELLNAAGERLVAGEPVPRGRVVLGVSLDGLAGQRETGQLTGIAGIEVRLDNQLVAGLPTVTDGPAAAGRYQFGLSFSRLNAGSHVIEVRVLGTVSGTRPRGQWLSFHVLPG